MMIVAEYADAIGPWGRGIDALATWACSPRGQDSPPSAPRLANVPGFIESPFLNLVYATQASCLRRVQPTGGAAPIGVVLASVLGDTNTADRASIAVAAAKMPLPLLFYQSVPSAILGKVTAEMPVSGPLVCLSGGPELFKDALETAGFLLDGGITHVLVSYVEGGAGRWRKAAQHALKQFWGERVVPDWDCALSVLLGTSEDRGVPAVPESSDRLRDLPRPLRDFAELALATAHGAGENSITDTKPSRLTSMARSSE